MNKSFLNKQFILDNIGHSSFDRLLSLKSIEQPYSFYIKPIIALIGIMLNVLVLILSTAIYSKTKKKNHKPAFLYIGALAFFDLLMGSGIAIYHFGLPTEISRIQKLSVQDIYLIYPSCIFIQFGSLHVLAVLTIDRYIFIKRPLHYPLIMTPCKTWLMLSAALFGALLMSILAAFSIEIPDYGYDETLFVHVFNGWFYIALAFTNYFLLFSLTWIYSVILAKFRKSKKTLEALQSMADETFTNITFQQSRGIFKKEIPSQFAAETIQTLSFKSIETSQEKTYTKEYQKRKRRSSSVTRRLTALVSHVNAAKYVLVLLVTLLITLFPQNSYLVFDNISHMINDHQYKPNGTVNRTAVLYCFKKVLHNQECHMDIVIENHQHLEYQEMIKDVAHVEESTIMLDLLIFLALLNVILNPVLYALWYPEFRRYLLKIPGWFKPKTKQTTDDFKFEMQIVKF